MKQIYLGLLLFAIGGTVNAFLPAERFKNLNLAADDDLNPLHGVPWAEGILENHAELMNYNDPLRALIEKLFHRTGLFEPTTVVGTFGREATPELIGKLLGAMKAKVHLAKTQYKGGIPKSLSSLVVGDVYPSVVYRTFLTLLRYKAHTREDYKAYYEGIHSTYPAGVHMPPNWDVWLEEKFTPDIALSPAVPDLETHYDAYLFWVLDKLVKAPPLEKTNDAINTKFGTFPDCGETSLRNFIKLILDDGGVYNLSVLKELGAGHELVAFFEKFKTRKSQADTQARESPENAARNEWSNFTVDHKKVRYYPDRHDMNAGADNMLILLKILLPGLKSADWGGVFKEIEQARQKNKLGSFALEEHKLIKNEFGTLSFQVGNLGRFVWHFKELHFYIEPLPGQSLGAYPFTDKKEQIFNDVAIFYPGKSLPNNFENIPWYLYTSLRSDEKIEDLITNASLPISAVTGLANRLSTQDARSRVFLKIAKEFKPDRLRAFISDEHLTLHKEYPSAFSEAKETAAARFLAGTKRFKEKFGVYLFGHSSSVKNLALSSDGHTLYSGSGDNTIGIWDLGHLESEPRRLGPLRNWKAPYGTVQELNVDGIALSPDGRTLYSLGFDDEAVQIWDLPKAELTARLSRFGDPLHSLPAPKKNLVNGGIFALSPDGHTLYLSEPDLTQIGVWDLTKREKVNVLQSSGEVYALSPNGHTLYTGKTYKKEIHVWDLLQPEKAPPRVLNVPWWRGSGALALSRDGESLYLGSYHDGEVKILDLRNPEKEYTLRTDGPGGITAFALSLDGHTLYAGRDKGDIQVWDLRQPDKTPLVLVGHEKKISALVLSPDGHTLYSGSWDSTIRVWDLEKEMKKAVVADPDR